MGSIVGIEFPRAVQLPGSRESAVAIASKPQEQFAARHFLPQR